jgi:hypothetical protein
MIAVMVFVLLFTATADAEEKLRWVGFSGDWWEAEIEGDVTVGQNGTGSNLELDSVLGIDDDSVLTFQLGMVGGAEGAMQFYYSTAQFSGSKTLTGAAAINGVSFSSGQRVSTDLKIKDFGVVYSTGIPGVGKEEGIGFRTWFGYAKWTSDFSGTVNSTDESLGIPYYGLGIFGRFPMGHTWSLTAGYDIQMQMEDFIAPGTDDKEMFRQFYEVGAILHPDPQIGIGIGYRFYEWDSTYDSGDSDNELDLGLEGYYLRVEFRF